jgi:hypothetical protein
MQPLIIDLQSVTPDLLRPIDNPILTAALEEAFNRTRPMLDGAGFDNNI